MSDMPELIGYSADLFAGLHLSDQGRMLASHDDTLWFGWWVEEGKVVEVSNIYPKAVAGAPCWCYSDGDTCSPDYVSRSPRVALESRQSANVAEVELRDEVERLRARVAELEAMSVPQPIETAPKDGTRVLLYAEKCWIEGAWYDARNKWEIVVLAPHGCGCCGYSLQDGDITHWLPMPQTPEVKP